MSKYPSQMQEKFNLRFPDGMRDAIAKRAEQNGRSMNSEIIQILSDALTEPEVPQNMNLKDLKELIAANKKLIAFLESGSLGNKKPT